MVTSRYTALLDERARLVAEGEATFQAAEAAGRGLTAEEQAVDDARETRLAEIRSEIAAFALMVDAKDERAAAFYRHHGFIALPNAPLTLVIPFATVQTARTTENEAR